MNNMDKIEIEVLSSFQNLREQYKQLTKNLLYLNEKKKEYLQDKYEFEHRKTEYYNYKSSSSQFFTGLFWRAKFIKKSYIGKRLIGEMKKLEIRSKRISGEIKKFKVNS